jgi:hypothetical protein
VRKYEVKVQADNDKQFSGSWFRASAMTTMNKKNQPDTH